MANASWTPANGDAWAFVRKRLDDAMRHADEPYERCSAELDAIASDIVKWVTRRLCDPGAVPTPAGRGPSSEGVV